MISVKLIAYTQPCDDNNELVESVVASAANLCYNGMGAKDILKDMSEEKANRLTKQMVDSGHHSTLEHVSFTFAIEGVSRACTHQLVRHRIASYSQQSQRYVKAKNFRQTVIMPDSILSNNRAQAIFNYTMDVVGSCYNELLGLGIPSEDARFILPNATETKIVVTMNARSLLHFFSERMCMRAQWEIRELATQMLLECRKVAPKLFEKAGPTCVTDGYCREGLHSCGRITKFVGGANGKQRATQRAKG